MPRFDRDQRKDDMIEKVVYLNRVSKTVKGRPRHEVLRSDGRG